MIGKDEIIAEAKKYINEPDLIMDMYDATILYVSDKSVEVSGIPRSESIGKMGFKFQDMKLSDAQKQSMANMTKSEGENDYTVKTAKGLMDMKFKFMIFVFDKVYYYVGQMLSYKKV